MLHTTANPTQSALEELERKDAKNPFSTLAFANAERALGKQLALITGPAGQSPALGLITKGRLTKKLSIPSTPAAPQQNAFWNELFSFCEQESVTTLELDSFAAPAGKLPQKGSKISSRPRAEWILPLTLDSPLAELSSRHKRNAEKAEKAGVVITEASSEEAIAKHIELIASSLDRRTERGEAIAGIVPRATVSSYLEHGAAKLYQATQGAEVLSSILLLRASEGAYYHSAGTTPEGMSCGASQFLICGLARRLAADGVSSFNLGGAEPGNPGLESFKKGFGAHSIELEAARYNLAPPIRRYVLNAINLIKQLGE